MKPKMMLLNMVMLCVFLLNPTAVFSNFHISDETPKNVGLAKKLLLSDSGVNFNGIKSLHDNGDQQQNHYEELENNKLPRTQTSSINRKTQDTSDMASSKLNEPQKRTPLSVNQDLMTIVNMLEGTKGSSSAASVNRLHTLGKRAPLSVNQDLMAIVNMLHDDNSDLAAAQRLFSLGKRAPLSVNQDLMAIANMLHNEDDSSMSNQRLLSLGKRNSPLYSSETSNRLSPRMSADYLSLLNRRFADKKAVVDGSGGYRVGKRRQLSFGIPLHTLQTMMREQRARRLQTGRSAAYARLLSLGRR